MRFFIFGAPGSGKSTQAQKMAEYYIISHLDFGTILREEEEKQTQVGKEIAKYKIGRGNFIPDDLAIEIFEKKYEERDIKKRGFVLEGFPRTLTQAIAVDNFLRKSNMKMN